MWTECMKMDRRDVEAAIEWRKKQEKWDIIGKTKKNNLID